MVEKAVKAALEYQSAVFEQRLADTTQNMQRQIDTLSIKSETPEVVVYEAAKVIPGIKCDEPLDTVYATKLEELPIQHYPHLVR